MDLAKTFTDIKFVSETHQYFVDGEQYLSVSSLIDTFVAPFERERMSEKVAGREGISPEEIRSLWDIRRDLSTVRGTEFHLYVEKYLQDGRKIETITPIAKEIEQFHQFWDKKNKKRYEVFACELILYDKSLKLAGTLDCLLRHKKSKKIYIIDWKTNSQIKMENEYQNFLPPFEQLPVSDINKYSLQIGLYRYLLENNTDLKVAGAYLVHFPKASPFKAILCHDLSQNIETMLSLRQQALNQ